MLALRFKQKRETVSSPRTYKNKQASQTDRQTETHIDRQTDRQTATHMWFRDVYFICMRRACVHAPSKHSNNCLLCACWCTLMHAFNHNHAHEPFPSASYCVYHNKTTRRFAHRCSIILRDMHPTAFVCMQISRVCT